MTDIQSKLDHIVVAASTLQLGSDYVEQLLGVEVPVGGEHVMMGTHNRVMTLSNNCYLEIVAVNPEMTPPTHPRWFGLDDPAVIALLDQSPRLITWAINTPNLQRLCDASEISVGNIAAASRGDLRWNVALTDDGRLAASGFFPLCIQWQVNFHPSERMANLDCTLKQLTMFHPYPAWLQQTLKSIGADHLVKIEPTAGAADCRIEALISTPGGEATLSSSII